MTAPTASKLTHVKASVCTNHSNAHCSSERELPKVRHRYMGGTHFGQISCECRPPSGHFSAVTAAQGCSRYCVLSSGSRRKDNLCAAVKTFLVYCHTYQCRQASEWLPAPMHFDHVSLSMATAMATHGPAERQACTALSDNLMTHMLYQKLASFADSPQRSEWSPDNVDMSAQSRAKPSGEFVKLSCFGALLRLRQVFNIHTKFSLTLYRNLQALDCAHESGCLEELQG